ncbi:MAG TPA: 1,4-dihydroxy-2-naphthoate polyprenyltransferase [Jiangellaceae bacterium]|nr:1,4-dihydroxy-2-naphthoate polyprenyltransferase [Jiangellaceae bacterium]
MAAVSPWVVGARPRTLPAAISPVIVGTGAAAAVGSAIMSRALLALVVALALQIGVNYANDYSDGVRGTDDARIGPLRLVGSGIVGPRSVLVAAWLAFGVAAVAGLFLIIVSRQWWLLVVGAVAIGAAWYYTGGSRPYGYRGFGEVSVFVFFGLVAVVGTTYVQVGRVTASSVISGIAIGALASALLLANNLRDAPTDAVTGKRTLAVFLGSRRTRLLYLLLVAVAYGLAVALALGGRSWAGLALLSAPLAMKAALPIVQRARGADLIPVLRDTGLTELAYAVLLAIGLALSAPG